MNKIVIGYCVGITILAATSASVLSLTDRTATMMREVDVPFWQTGDEWTYSYEESRTVDPSYYFTGDLTYTVIDASGDSYTLESATKPSGSFILGNIGLKTTLFSRITMRLHMRKADLGLERFIQEIKGIWRFSLGSITLPIPIQLLGRYNVTFDPTWAVLPFPLYDGKYGNLSSVEILHVNDTLHLFWGLILAYGPLTEAIPIGSMPYTCSEEEISVHGNTFEVINVSAEWMEGSQCISYYSKEVGNVVKIVIRLLTSGKRTIYANILELKEWSYTP